MIINDVNKTLFNSKIELTEFQYNIIRSYLHNSNMIYYVLYNKDNKHYYIYSENNYLERLLEKGLLEKLYEEQINTLLKKSKMEIKLIINDIKEIIDNTKNILEEVLKKDNLSEKYCDKILDFMDEKLERIEKRNEQ